jgi:hypothetical protein
MPRVKTATKAKQKAKRPSGSRRSAKVGKAQRAAKALSPAKSRGATKTKASTRTRTAAKAKPAAKPRSPASAAKAQSASQLIEQRIQSLGGWRGASLARMRQLILEADPDIIEEWKWDVPVWSHHGIVCTGEAYKKAVKLTFARGAGIPDPTRLFNSSLEGNTRRALDIHEGEEVDAAAFKALIKAAVAHNAMSGKRR